MAESEKPDVPTKPDPPPAPPAPKQYPTISAMIVDNPDKVKLETIELIDQVTTLLHNLKTMQLQLIQEVINHGS